MILLNRSVQDNGTRTVANDVDRQIVAEATTVQLTSSKPEIR